MIWRTALGVAAAVVVLAGCGSGAERDDMEADTARFTWGDRTLTVPLTECVREDDIVILAGELDGMVVQAAADLSEGGLDRSGVTGDMGGDDGIWGAFGSELEQGPAGEITRVDVDRDRLIVEGRWVRFDADSATGAMVPETGSEIDGKLVARCPESSEVS